MISSAATASTITHIERNMLLLLWTDAKNSDPAETAITSMKGLKYRLKAFSVIMVKPMHRRAVIKAGINISASYGRIFFRMK